MRLIAFLLAGIAAGITREDLPAHQEALKKAVEAPEILLEEENDQVSQRDEVDEVNADMLRRLETLTQRCPATIDLVVNQDTSGSLTPRNLNEIKRKLRVALEAIGNTYPDSRFGLSRFTDIPQFPFGKSSDVCYERIHELDTDVDAFISSFGTLTDDGGKDYPESQYTALMSSALDTVIGYRGDMDDGTPVAKIILTITDSIPHCEGDGLFWGLESNPGTFPPNCAVHDYPSFEQISSALENRKAIPAFFVRERSGFIWFPNPVPVYQEFVEVVMSDHGSVTYTDSFNNIQTQILDAIDLAMEDWCNKYPVVTTTDDITSEQTCAAHDTLFVRDLTSSTKEDIGNMKKFVQNYIDAAKPESRFGLVSHSDKPLEPFGYPISLDYCYWRHSDMTTEEAFMAAYEDADSDHRSGGDFPENQLDAAIRGASDMTWEYDNARCNCVVFLTDAFYHEAGDFPSGTPYDPDTDVPYDPDTDPCVSYDYPSVQQVADVLAENKIGCVIVATMEVVTEFWDQFETDLRAGGFTGTFNIEVIPEPGPVRKLSASFASQPKLDLRHLENRPNTQSQSY